MAKKNMFSFLEDSLNDISEKNTRSIETKSNELIENVTKNAAINNTVVSKSNSSAAKPALPVVNIDKNPKKIKIVSMESNYDKYTPAIKKVLKKIDSDTFSGDGSMRLDKTTIHELKAVCVELDVAAYKLVTVLIRDFIEKYHE